MLILRKTNLSPPVRIHKQAFLALPCNDEIYARIIIFLGTHYTKDLLMNDTL